MTTQEKYPWRATVRTLFQAFLALVAMYGVVAATGGLPSTGFFGGLLGVTAAISRVMQLPAVTDFINTYLPWLAAEPPVSSS